MIDNQEYEFDLNYFDSHEYFNDIKHHDEQEELSNHYEPKVKNYTGVELGYEFENDDSAWVMACVFIIFTMQTGNYNAQSICNNNETRLK